MKSAAIDIHIAKQLAIFFGAHSIIAFQNNYIIYNVHHSAFGIWCVKMGKRKPVNADLGKICKITCSPQAHFLVSVNACRLLF